MNAQQVVNRIVSQAQAAADETINAARQKAQQQQKRLEASLAEYRSQTARLADEAGKDKKERTLAAARMDIKKEYLAAKVRIVEELFEKVRNRINSLGDNDYQALMSGLLLKAVQSGDEEVIGGRNDRRINDELIRMVNGQLGSGFKGNIRLSAERADIAGGFILRRGKIQVNAGTDVIVGRLRDKFEIEINKELFGGSVIV